MVLCCFFFMKRILILKLLINCACHTVFQSLALRVCDWSGWLMSPCWWSGSLFVGQSITFWSIIRKGMREPCSRYCLYFPSRVCQQASQIESKSKPVFHTVRRFRFPTQRIPTSSQDCPRGSPTWSRCTLSSKERRARQTGLKLPQVSSPRTRKKTSAFAR